MISEIPPIVPHGMEMESSYKDSHQRLPSMRQTLVQASKFCLKTLVQIWTFPNTAVGLIYGVIGIPFGAKTHWDPQAGILRFTDHPFMASAISLGDVQIYGQGHYKDLDGAYHLNRFGKTIVGEENLHTQQARILGPAYLPAHILSMGASWLLSGHTHHRNLLEYAPERHAGLWPWQINNRGV